MKSSKIKITRRQLLKNAAAIGTAAAVFPQIVPRHVVGGAEHTPPSETVNVAGIGVGTMGGFDIRGSARAGARIVSLCDVDRNNAKSIFDAFPDASRYTDYREMLEQEDGIDAVIVGTPDHTHAKISIDAMQLGKHVYCEKPLAHTMYECRVMAEAAQKYGVATQLGNQGHSYPSNDEFCEIIWSDTIGTVREIHVIEAAFNFSRIRDISKLTESHSIPKSLDWDLWLGPAQDHKFNPMFHPGMWRCWSRFGSGMIGDFVCHIVDPVFTALNLDAPTSAVAEAKGWDPSKHGETFPQSCKVTFEFPARGNRAPVTLYWYDGDSYSPPRPEELSKDEEFIPTLGRGGGQVGGHVVGDKGAITYGSHGAANWRILPDSAMNEYMENRTRVADPRGQGMPNNDAHHEDFLQACKGWDPAGSNFDHGGPLTEIAMLGNIAQKFPGQELEWDSKLMKITNVPEANQHLHYRYREGWAL